MLLNPIDLLLYLWYLLNLEKNLKVIRDVCLYASTDSTWKDFLEKNFN